MSEDSEFVLGRLLDGYKHVKGFSANTRELYWRKLRDFNDFMVARGGTALTALSDDVSEYASARSDWAKSTTHCALSFLRRFFDYCVSEGCVGENPVLEEHIQPNKPPANVRCQPDKDSEAVLERLLDGYRRERGISAVSRKQYWRWLRRFNNFMVARGGTALTALHEDVADYVDERGSWTNTTIRNTLSFLRSFFDYCVSEGSLRGNPIHEEDIPSRAKGGRRLSKDSEAVLERLLDGYRLERRLAEGTRELYWRKLRDFNDFMEARGCTALTALHEDVADYVDEHGSWANTTMRSTLFFFLNFFDYCVSKGCVEENPIHREDIPPIETARSEGKPVPEEVLRRMQKLARAEAETRGDDLSLRTYASLCLNLRCGVGWTSQAEMRAGDYVTDGGMPRVLVSGTAGGFALVDEVTASALDRYLDATPARRPDDPLFIRANARNAETGVGGKALSKWVNKLASACGVSLTSRELTAGLVHLAISNGVLPQETTAFLRVGRSAIVDRATFSNAMESLAETQWRITDALDSERPLATGIVALDELERALDGSEGFSRVAFTVRADGTLSFGGYRD